MGQDGKCCRIASTWDRAARWRGGCVRWVSRRQCAVAPGLGPCASAAREDQIAARDEGGARPRVRAPWWSFSFSSLKESRGQTRARLVGVIAGTRTPGAGIGALRRERAPSSWEGGMQEMGRDRRDSGSARRARGRTPWTDWCSPRAAVACCCSAVPSAALPVSRALPSCPAAGTAARLCLCAVATAARAPALPPPRLRCRRRRAWWWVPLPLPDRRPVAVAASSLSGASWAPSRALPRGGAGHVAVGARSRRPTRAGNRVAICQGWRGDDVVAARLCSADDPCQRRRDRGALHACLVLPSDQLEDAGGGFPFPRAVGTGDGWW